MTENANERIKILREALGLSQTEFGAELGVTAAAISRVEKGINQASDRLILSVCKNRWHGRRVSEAWLRSGEGEMFLATSDAEEVAAFVGEVLGDDRETLKKAVLVEIARMPPEAWDWIEDVIERIIKKRAD